MPRLQDVHLNVWGSNRDGVTEGLARTLELTARYTPQAERVESSPVDGRRDRGLNSYRRLSRSAWVQVAGPEPWTPAPHR